MKNIILSPQQVQICADPRDYYLLWFKDIPDDCDKGFVGAVYNSSDPDIKVRIEIDEKWLLENRKRGACLLIDNDNYKSASIIVVTKDVFDRMYRQQIELSTIWHEIGHFHTTKYFLDYLTENQEKKRAEYISRNQIPPAEYVADLFALYYSEREDVIEWIKGAIRGRYKLIGSDDNARAAWNELRDRRDALKKIETDEEIERELCRVCGVESIDML